MQPTGGDMPGMPPSMTPCLNSSAPRVTLHELPNGQAQQQQQRPQSQGSAIQDYDHSTAAAHEDFFDQVLSSLPWVELNPANSKSPWDLAAANGGGEAAAANGQRFFSVSLVGKSAMEEQAEGLHYTPPYDESALLASRLRQHQISGCGGPTRPGKQAVPVQLNHASQQQQHMLVAGMGRSAAAGDSGLLPLPLSLGSGDSADSTLLLDRSRGDVDASFKSLATAVGDGLYNRFGGSLQRAAPPATANQQNFHNPQGSMQAGAVPSQNLGGAGLAPAAGSAPPRQRVRARRGQATDPHSIAERLRRERIAERMKALQELVPNANKTDKASMLDEIIDYVKFLQLQVKVLSMSRLGGAAAVVPLVADMSSEASAGRNSAAGQAAAGGDGLTATEHQVARLMEDDIGSAMQYLQGKGLCLMPISLASAISATTGHARAANLPNGGGGNNQNGTLLVPHAPASNADAPSSPSMSVLTVQSAMANGGDASTKDAASVSKP